MSSTLKNYKEEKLPYKNVDPEFAHLLPKNLTPVDIHFEIHNSSTPIVNGLRRVFIEELPIKGLSIDGQSIRTNDKTIIVDTLVNRIHCIPIHQKVPLSAKFTLSVINNDTVPRIIRSSDIKLVSGGEIRPADVFDETHIIVTLGAKCKLEIGNITIIERSAFREKDSHGAYTIAAGFRYKPLNVEPPKVDGKEIGRFSIATEPKNFALTFRTNGNIDSKTLIPLCCDNIIDRVKNIENNLKTLLIHHGTHVAMTLDWETEVIGNLLLYYLKVDGRLSSVVPVEGRRLDFSIIGDVDIDEVEKKMADCLRKIIREYEHIKLTC